MCGRKLGRVEWRRRPVVCLALWSALLMFWAWSIFAPAAAQTASVGPGYTDAQAIAAVQNGLTSFANPNLQMPNGAYIAHTIYNATSSATINGSSDETCFGSSGLGNQSVPTVGFYAGAKFVIQCGGSYTTGVASVATLTIKIKFGSTAVATFTTLALPSSVTGLAWFVDATCTVRVAGVSGSIVCTRGVSYVTTSIGVAPLFNPLLTASPVSVDLSGTTTKIDVTGSFSSLVGSPSATSIESSIQQVN